MKENKICETYGEQYEWQMIMTYNVKRNQVVKQLCVLLHYRKSSPQWNTSPSTEYSGMRH